VEHSEPEVEQARGDRLAVDERVPFVQVPAARPHDERRDLLVQAVPLLRRLERDLPAHRLVEVPLPLDDVLPGGRARVLEVGHEDARSRVERVDHHLALDRAGDLDAAVEQIRGRRRDAPVALTYLPRLRWERRAHPRLQLRLPLAPPLEQLGAARTQLPLEKRNERERIRRENVLATRSEQVDAGGSCRDVAHRAAALNCASSVEPSSASVEVSPLLTARATASK
jgi:hypothetical protein